MPRLSTKQYLETHKYLRDLWLHRQIFFSLLPPANQWTLHQFFVPDHELNVKELAAYRKDITARLPSLPHRAGRVLRKFDRLSIYELEEQLDERLGRAKRADSAVESVSQARVLNPRRAPWQLKIATTEYLAWLRSKR